MYMPGRTLSDSNLSRRMIGMCIMWEWSCSMDVVSLPVKQPSVTVQTESLLLLHFNSCYWVLSVEGFQKFLRTHCLPLYALLSWKYIK